MPTFACFSICDTCILRCQMCQKWKNDIYIKPQQRMMALDDWKACARSLREITPPDFIINFGGGEITTIPWLFDLIRFCHDAHFRTNIATNGFLIDEAMVAAMAESGLDYVNLSLDSLDEATHDRLRGVPGVYQKVMNAVRLIAEQAENVKISMCSIIMDPTLDGMSDLVNWVQNNEHIDMIYLMVLMQPNNTAPVTGWWRDEGFAHLWPKNYAKAEAVLDELIALKRRGYKICNSVEHIQAFKAYLYDPGTYVKDSRCNIDHAIHISSVGDLFMCYRHELLGDVREMSIKDMWESEHAAVVRRTITRCRENCHFLLNCKFEE